ncbi:MAG: hypothetical protein AAF378_18200 [Cyanobacteria bacterium P01_A01_bin.84]
MGLELIKQSEERKIINSFLHQFTTQPEKSVREILAEFEVNSFEMQSLIRSYGLVDQFEAARLMVKDYRVDNLESWFKGVKLPPITTFNKFLMACRMYAETTLTVEEIVKQLWNVKNSNTARDTIARQVRTYPQLAPLWERCKLLRKATMFKFMAEEKDEMALQAFKTINEAMKPRTKHKVTKKKGKVVVGNQLHEVDSETVTSETVLGDVAAATVALRMLGLDKRTVEVNHNHKVIQEFNFEEIDNIQKQQEAELLALQEEIRKGLDQDEK